MFEDVTASRLSGLRQHRLVFLEERHVGQLKAGVGVGFTNLEGCRFVEEGRVVAIEHLHGPVRVFACKSWK
jgi:hypothetical protein